MYWRVNDKYLGYFSDHPCRCPFNYYEYLRDDDQYTYTAK